MITDQIGLLTSVFDIIINKMLVTANRHCNPSRPTDSIVYLSRLSRYVSSGPLFGPTSDVPAHRYPSHQADYGGLGRLPAVCLGRPARHVLSERNSAMLASPVTVKIAPPEVAKCTAPKSVANASLRYTHSSIHQRSIHYVQLYIAIVFLMMIRIG